MKILHNTLVILLLAGSSGAQWIDNGPLQVRLEGEDIVFEGEVCLDSSAQGPTTLVGIPRMKVEMRYARTGPNGFEELEVVQQTDVDGRLTIPDGWQPFYGDAYGPQSDDVIVEQQISIGGIVAPFNPVAELDFISFGAPRVFSYPAPWILQSAHVNAYYHAQKAFQVLPEKVGPPPALPVNLRFMIAQDSPYDPDTAPDIASYRVTRIGAVVVDRSLHIWGAADPDDCDVARSATGIAHEIGHHFLSPFGFQEEDDILCYSPSDHFGEGLADYLACVVTGHSVVGRGILGMQERVIAANPTPRYPQTFDCSLGAHERGKVIAGCLLDSRIRFEVRVVDGAAVFDGMALAVLDVLRSIVPYIDDLVLFPDEASVLQYLIDENPDPISLRILYEAFSLGGGVPWPYFWVPTGFGVQVPALTAQVSGGQLDLSIADAAAGAPLLVFGSLDPSAPWVFGPASVYLDPGSLVLLGARLAGPDGTASLAFAIPPSAVGLDAALAAVVPPGAGSVAISNGILIQL